MDFVPGQRWISDAELHLGLGTVLAVDPRRVTVLFLATGDTRIYAKETAPLTRVAFGPGDSVRAHDGWALKVRAVKERDGLLTYVGTCPDGREGKLEEPQLDNLMQLNRPGARLFTGQIDAHKRFELRYETLLHINRLAHSDLRGLTGARTSLISHQLYIAHEVANRFAPRVLLADEVGLGKTIEAGLILHQQLLTERARRVLIVVPETLMHQWLVEMVRRFNLHFSIFDEARCVAVEEGSGQENPFQSEQLVICSLRFLIEKPLRLAQALAGEWDLLVVDEAHHLEWSPRQASVDYEVVERLAAVTPGVLLLTATPEQFSKAGHFARLRLLDPDRFPDFDRFIAEETAYEPVADAVQKLLSGAALDVQAHRLLLSTIEEGDNQTLLKALQDDTVTEAQKETARAELVEHLLDRHGTGRVLFRNTRAAVKGFPERAVTGYPLPLPSAYADGPAESEAAQDLLCPELIYQAAGNPEERAWFRIDPRVRWLGEKLRELRPKKALVITATAATAMDLAEALRTMTGIHAAVFHEKLSLVERDRAAAYFADREYGSQVLVCSEIGSEGRNFQFAHHLILFDLPLNPDLLEQRIGRLDRIGQNETVRIHVPYLKGTAQEVMFRWYQEGLGAFEHPCPAGHRVFVQLEQSLISALRRLDGNLAVLIEQTRMLHAALNEELHRGRDRLLEYNSCRPRLAGSLRERALQEDRESVLPEYLERLFDCFGVDIEEHSEASFIIRPSGHMQTESLPGLSEEGLTFTCDRELALANEDMQFLTWEHPLVTGAMDMIVSGEGGNTAATMVKTPGIKPGTLLLECLYIVESTAADALQASRYLPPTVIRVVVDGDGNDQDAELPHELLKQARQTLDAETANRVIRAYEKELRVMLAEGERLAREQAPGFIDAAHRDTWQILSREIDRLKALRQVNPNVRAEEIGFFETQWQALDTAFDAASVRLDALRVIVTA